MTHENLSNSWAIWPATDWSFPAFHIPKNDWMRRMFFQLLRAQALAMMERLGHFHRNVGPWGIVQRTNSVPCWPHPFSFPSRVSAFFLWCHFIDILGSGAACVAVHRQNLNLGGSPAWARKVRARGRIELIFIPLSALPFNPWTCGGDFTMRVSLLLP